MRGIVGRIALTCALAVAFVSVIAGISVGSSRAPGDPLIIGSTSNNAGTSRTALTAKTASNSFVVYNTDGGSALRGYNKSTGNGVYGTAQSALAGNGVFAENLGSAAPGNFGTAVLGKGNHTWGVVGTTFAGGNPGAGLDGEDQSGVTSGVASQGFSGTGIAVLGHAFDPTGNGWGGFFSTASGDPSAWGVVAEGCGTSCGSGKNQAALFSGNVEVDGNLTVTGTCTGCARGAIAVNGTNATIHRGDAVALLGARAGLTGGMPLLVVGTATAGSHVIGIAEGEMVAEKVGIRTGAAQRVGPLHRLVEGTRTSYVFRSGGASAAADRYLLVVTQGVVSVAAVDASAGAVHAGDALTVGSTAGRFELARPITVQGRSFTVPGTSVGYALESLVRGSGTMAVFVSPH